MRIPFAGGLPGQKMDHPAGARGLEAVDVDAHFVAGLRPPFVDGGNRNAHFAVPDLAIRIDVGFDSHSGVPKALVVPAEAISGGVDGLVEEFALGGDLKLAVE